MASYSTGANVQNLVYGATNTDLDAASTAARDAATSIINSYLDIQKDIASPSDAVTRCCTLLAAGMLSTGPKDKLEENTYYKAGIALLESLKRDTTGDADWGRSFPVERHNSNYISGEADVYALW